MTSGDYIRGCAVREFYYSSSFHQHLKKEVDTRGNVLRLKKEKKRSLDKSLCFKRVSCHTFLSQKRRRNLGSRPNISQFQRRQSVFLKCITFIDTRISRLLKSEMIGQPAVDVFHKTTP